LFPPLLSLSSSHSTYQVFDFFDFFLTTLVVPFFLSHSNKSLHSTFPVSRFVEDSSPCFVSLYNFV